MLNTLQQQPADALLALIKLHNEDPRPEKIDLGVGVYRTDTGATPVFAAIKAAEKKLLEVQDSKAYLGPEGDMGFVRQLMPYIFGAENPTASGRIEGMQTPGGTGGVRLALGVAKRAGAKRVLMGQPSWPNHAQIITDLGLEVKGFSHSTAAGTVDMEALRAAIAGAEAGDAILLHGCCHNPTGIDYSPADWDEIAELVVAKGILPIVDLAYQGLGAGMEEDAYGLRKIVGTAPEALIAYSCDKNFGLYRDRVGAFYMLTQTPEQLPVVVSNAYALARANWSMPPDHGGAAVRLVLEDPALVKLWLGELDEMRGRMRQMRDKLSAAGQTGGVDLTALGGQNGLFSIIPFTAEQIAAIRKDYGIYFAGSGRINVAGLTNANIDRFIAATAAVTG